ncbi:root UVB sensitive 3 protein [Nymphaea thermarum]|nr:root UVB sensitive 3 protein [Nymphaea thermarum]
MLRRRCRAEAQAETSTSADVEQGSRHAKYLLLEQNGIICVIIHKDSTADDVLQSYIHALVVAHLLNIGRHAQAESNIWVDKNYSIFMSKLQASGWNTERLLAPAVVYRASWECNPTTEKKSGSLDRPAQALRLVCSRQIKWSIFKTRPQSRDGRAWRIKW